MRDLPPEIRALIWRMLTSRGKRNVARGHSLYTMYFMCVYAKFHWRLVFGRPHLNSATSDQSFLRQ